MNEALVRERLALFLEGRGYTVVDIGRGSGVRPMSRLSIEKEGVQSKCVVKLTTSGRIHFVWKAGKFKVLDDVDVVIVAQPEEDNPDLVRVWMFDQKVVLEAFEINRRALEEHNMGHIPAWVSPEKEEGWRFTGSGFKDRARWFEKVSVSSVQDSPKRHHPSPVAEARYSRMTIQEAKEQLAATFGVSPDKIEITIRG